jgi:hypothetical protein
MTADVVIPGPAVTVSAGRDGEGGSGGPVSRLCPRPAARRVCFTLEAFASTL